jgi:hypothetical protein
VSDRAARTSRLGSTCSVSDDANHNHDSNDTGNHAATAPFSIPRIIGVSDRSGVWICHADLRGGLTPEGLTPLPPGIRKSGPSNNCQGQLVSRAVPYTTAALLLIVTCLLTCRLAILRQSLARRSHCSGNLLPPSPPAQKTTTRQDQSGKACTGDGAWNTNGIITCAGIISCAGIVVHSVD